MGSNYLIKLLSQIFTQMVIVLFTPESLRYQPLLIPGFDIKVNNNLKDFPFSPFQWGFFLLLLSARCYDYHIQFDNALFYLIAKYGMQKLKKVFPQYLLGLSEMLIPGARI